MVGIMMNAGENIDDLLVAYLLKELDQKADDEVALWLNASTDNQQRLDELSRIWEVTKDYKHLKFDTQKAWNKVDKQISVTPFYQNTWLRIAAAILIVFGAAQFWLNAPGVDAQQWVASNEIVTDTLIDGSIITLNTHSTLAHTETFNDKTREVTLEGEAFFDIERDTSKPFIIHLQYGKVTVLGTSFNIKSYLEDELVRVYVKSGVVLFEYLSDITDSTYLSVTLKAGDKVVYNKTTQQLELSNSLTSSNMDMYWMDQELIFDGITLEKVANILEAVYNVNIRFTDESSKQCKLTVNFQNAEIDQIMEVIALTFELELEKQPGNYVLKGVSCANN